MPRTIHPTLQSTLATGGYNAYIKAVYLDEELNEVITDVLSYKIHGARLELETPGNPDTAWIKIRRGVTIAGVNYTLDTSKFYIRHQVYDFRTTKIRASLFQMKKISIAGDDSYRNVLEGLCTAINKTAVFRTSSATQPFWDYQFLPDGRQLILNDPERIIPLLNQKYFIGLCDNGSEQILFYPKFRSLSSSGTHVADHLYPNYPYIVESTWQANNRNMIWRDEAGTLHDNGLATYPIHNLGYLESTAQPPRAFYPGGTLLSQTSGITRTTLPLNLNYLDGDGIYISSSIESYQILFVFEVIEEFNRSNKIVWGITLQNAGDFSNTEGGALPSTIEAAAPYTPLNTSNFDGVLDETDNNIQAAMETIDDHHSTTNFSTDLANAITLAESKATPVGADSFPIHDSQAGNILKRVTMTNARTFMKNLFDTLYATIAHTHEVDQRADMFLDSEGDPAGVGKTADGTSTYAARRDHVHAMHDTKIDGLTIIYNSAASLDVGTGSCYAENGDYINNTSPITKSSLSLTSGTWYHIYIYLSGGTPTVDVATTAPAAWKGTAYSKTSDTSRRYLGSIIATASNTMAPFLHRVNTWLYNTATDVSPFRVLTGGSSQTPVNVDCSGAIPVTSRIGILRFTNLGTVSAFVGNGSTTILSLSAPASGFNHIMGPWILDANQDVMYDYNAAGGSLYIDVIGFQLDR